MFLKIIMFLLITLSFNGVYAQESNNQHTMKAFFKKLELLKRPSSLSKIAFCALNVIAIVYFFKKFFTNQKDQKEKINSSLGNPQSSSTKPSSVGLRIIIKPTPTEKLMDKEISFEFENVRYKGSIYVERDEFIFSENIYKTEEVYSSICTGMKNEIQRMYFIECENAHETFSYDKILLVTDWSVIPEKLNSQPKFSLLPSCTFL